MVCTGCHAAPCKCPLRSSGFPYPRKPEDCAKPDCGPRPDCVPLFKRVCGECEPCPEPCCHRCEPETKCLLIEHRVLAACSPRDVCELVLKLGALGLPLQQRIEPVSYLVEITIKNAGDKPVLLKKVVDSLAAAHGPFDVRRVSAVRVPPQPGDCCLCVGPVAVGACGDLLENLTELADCLCLQPCCGGFDCLKLVLELRAPSCIADCQAPDMQLPLLGGATLSKLHESITVVGAVNEPPCVPTPTPTPQCQDWAPPEPPEPTTVLRTLCVPLPT